MCLVLAPLLHRPGTAAAAKHKVQRAHNALYVCVTPSLASTLSVISGVGRRQSRSLHAASAEPKVQRADDAPYVGVIPNLASTLSVISGVGRRLSRSLRFPA